MFVFRGVVAPLSNCPTDIVHPGDLESSPDFFRETEGVLQVYNRHTTIWKIHGFGSQSHGGLEASDDFSGLQMDGFLGEQNSRSFAV